MPQIPQANAGMAMMQVPTMPNGEPATPTNMPMQPMVSPTSPQGMMMQQIPQANADGVQMMQPVAVAVMPAGMSMPGMGMQAIQMAPPAPQGYMYKPVHESSPTNDPSPTGEKKA